MKRETNQFRKVLLLLAMLLVSFDLLAQISVTGTVTDETGEGLPGVTVLEKGTTNGTITDLDGKFRLGVSSNDAVVVFSFVGYDTQEFSTSSSKNLKVVLKETAQQIEEVVVVGYGQQRKASVVGAITQASSKTIERAAGISDLGTALTGNLPGVVAQVAGNGGQPGAESTNIRIRGFNSFNEEAKALVLVDGIKRDMSSVDPASVQNVAVLKDASATAVFGVEGANGVILITTKRGQEGRAQINASYSTTLKTVSKLPGKYDAYDAHLFRNIAIEHELNLLPDNFANIRTQEYINNYRPADPTARDEFDNLITERFPNIDWQELLFKKVALSHNASLNISGGNKIVRYFTAVDWAKEGDLFDIPESGRGYRSEYSYNRFNVRSNLDFSLTKTTVFKVNLFGSLGVQKSPNSAGGEWQEQQKWSGAYNIAPDVYMPIYENGAFGSDLTGRYPNSTNSIEQLAIGGPRTTTTSKITTDFILEQNLNALLDGLSFRGSVSWDNQFQEVNRGVSDQFNNPAYCFIDPLTGKMDMKPEFDKNSGLSPALNPVKWNSNGGQWNNGALNRSVNYQLQLNWNKNFDKHFITAMGLFQRNESTYGDQYTYYREDWVFRLTYNWNDKYFCEYNGAYNGSEKFSPDYRFAFFNSGAIGWNIHNESFMSYLKENRIIDQLKIRGSYGQIGDDNVGGRWLYVTEWETSGATEMDSNGSGSPYSNYKEKKIGNPDIHWETVTKINLGIDYSFLDGKIAGSFELFKDKRKDCIVNNRPSVPAYFGATAVPANLGKVESHGYEFDVRLNKSFGKIHTWANLNMSHSENKIIFRDDPELYPDYRKQAGYMYGQVRTHVDNGNILSWDDMYATPATDKLQEERLMGDYTYIDFNADGKITDNDNIPYGYSQTSPQNSYNATLGVDYKGWAVFAQFYGVTNIQRDVAMTNFGNGQMNTVFDQGTWYSENTDNFEIATPRWMSNMYSNGTTFLRDASYIRLKTIELSYTWQKLNVGNFTFSNVKLYFNGNNIWTWSRLPDDRETNGSWSAGGGAYPLAKRFTFGIKFSL